MRNRKIQRMLRKSGEKGLSRRDTAGVLDLTPYEAVKNIIQKEKAAAIREAVETSARQCYVVEGVYPPDLHYLEENYGLQINTAEFYVVYDIYASNMPPTVKVVAK